MTKKACAFSIFRKTKCIAHVSFTYFTLNTKSTKHGLRKENDIFFICGALRDLATFVQYKKREKQPRRSANFN